MRLKVIVILVLLTLCSVACALVRQQAATQETAAVQVVAKLDPQLVRFSDYKKWRLVNPVPELMDPVSAAACAYVRAHDSPHASKYISVYVNEIGREAMLTQQKPKFPVGSVVIKEKLASKTSAAPELLTAMVKREPGYDAKNGDWEYLTLNGEATQIIASGQLKDCQSCHAFYSHTDYITRTYLPLEVVKNLK